MKLTDDEYREGFPLTDEEAEQVLAGPGEKIRLNALARFVEMGKVSEGDAYGYCLYLARGYEPEAKALMRVARESLTPLDELEIMVAEAMGTKKEAPPPPEGDEGASCLDAGLV